MIISKITDFVMFNRDTLPRFWKKLNKNNASSFFLSSTHHYWKTSIFSERSFQNPNNIKFGFPWNDARSGPPHLAKPLLKAVLETQTFQGNKGIPIPPKIEAQNLNILLNFIYVTVSSRHRKRFTKKVYNNLVHI